MAAKQGSGGVGLGEDAVFLELLVPVIVEVKAQDEFVSIKSLNVQVAIITRRAAELATVNRRRNFICVGVDL